MSKINGGMARSIFKVIESLKGTKSGAVLRVEHRTSGSACGFGFFKHRVLIAVRKHDNSSTYGTSRCSLYSDEHKLADESRLFIGAKTVGDYKDVSARATAKRDRISCFNNDTEPEERISACTRQLELKRDGQGIRQYLINRAE